MRNNLLELHLYNVLRVRSGIVNGRRVHTERHRKVPLVLLMYSHVPFDTPYPLLIFYAYIPENTMFASHTSDICNSSITRTGDVA